jgi:hypothetical protein
MCDGDDEMFPHHTQQADSDPSYFYVFMAVSIYLV